MSEVADVLMNRSYGTAAASATTPAPAATAAARGPRHPALDPQHQAGEEQRRDVEQIALFDAHDARLRRERGDLDGEQRDQRDRRSDDCALGRGQRLPLDAEEDEREERHEADIEIELRQVPEEPPRHDADVV